MKNFYDHGRVVRNFMTEDERETYKKFLPENKMTLPAIHFKPHAHSDGSICYTTDCMYRDSHDIQEYDRKTTNTYTVVFASGSKEVFPFDQLISFIEEWGLIDIRSIVRDSDRKLIYSGVVWTRNVTPIEKRLLSQR